MSRTIRNEKTRGYLDKLQKERETRKLIRESKSSESMYDFDLTFLDES